MKVWSECHTDSSFPWEADGQECHLLSL